MGITLPQIDYTSRDYQSFKDDMISTIQTKVPEWTNLSESDFGIILIELFCHMADSLAYYQDQQANEAFLSTARLRKNIINLCKLIGYTLSSATPSSVSLTFSITPAVGIRTIPVKSQVSSIGTTTEPSVIFETDIAISVPSSSSSVTGTATEGQTFQENLNIADGTLNQQYSLSKVPVIAASIVIDVDQGLGYETWTYLTNLVTAQPTDKVYTYSVNENGVVTVIFGDNVNGKVVPNGSNIRATYRVGGGIRGNVGAGTINTLVNVPAFVTAVTNPASASGGSDIESIEHAKIFAPASLRRANRAVTLSDFQTIAQGYPGVLQAGAVAVALSNTMQVQIYIEPTGGGIPTAPFLAAVKNYIDQFRTATTQIVLLAANYVFINISATITVQPNFSQAACLANVTAALVNFFLPGNFAFAQQVNLSDIYDLIRNVTGVNYLIVNGLSLSPLIYVVVNNGNAVFSAAPTISINSIAEIFTVTMTSPTAFHVAGSISGSQGNGTLDTPFTTTNGNLSFQINHGTIAMITGDSWTIRTSTNVGNVIINAFEVALLGTMNLNMVGGL